MLETPVGLGLSFSVFNRYCLSWLYYTKEEALRNITNLKDYKLFLLLSWLFRLSMLYFSITFGRFSDISGQAGICKFAVPFEAPAEYISKATWVNQLPHTDSGRLVVCALPGELIWVQLEDCWTWHPTCSICSWLSCLEDQNAYQQNYWSLVRPLTGIFCCHR